VVAPPHLLVLPDAPPMNEDAMRLARCVCSHPKAIHIGGGVCFRCGCGRFGQSAAGYTREESAEWARWLDTADAA